MTLSGRRAGATPARGTRYPGTRMEPTPPCLCCIPRCWVPLSCFFPLCALAGTVPKAELLMCDQEATLAQIQSPKREREDTHAADVTGADVGGDERIHSIDPGPIRASLFSSSAAAPHPQREQTAIPRDNKAKSVNDPAAGSPTATLLRLLLPLTAGHHPISAGDRRPHARDTPEGAPGGGVVA